MILQQQNKINIEDTMLSDFLLFSITSVSINVVQPTIVNNEEVSKF